MVAAVAAREVARKGVAAVSGRARGVDRRPWGNVVLFLEATVEEVDVEEGVIGTVATWELNALCVWERGTAVAGNVEVGAHGVELMTAAHQNDRYVSYDKTTCLRVVVLSVVQRQDLVPHDL